MTVGVLWLCYAFPIPRVFCFLCNDDKYLWRASVWFAGKLKPKLQVQLPIDNPTSDAVSTVSPKKLRRARSRFVIGIDTRVRVLVKIQVYADLRCEAMRSSVWLSCRGLQS